MKRLHTLIKPVLLGIIFQVSFGATAAMAATDVAAYAKLSDSLNVLSQTLQKYLDESSGEVLGASTITVSNDAELAAAIKAATGGETIQLSPGSYGSILIISGAYSKVAVGATAISGSPTLSSRVIIESKDPNNPAIVKSIDIRGSDNWAFNNLSVQPGFQKNSFTAVSLIGANIVFENSTVTYGDSTNWTATDWTSKAGGGIKIAGPNGLIKNNLLKSVYVGITADVASKNSIVSNNTVDGIAGDAARVLSDYTTFSNNFFKNFKKVNANHDDCLQSWGTANGRPDQNSYVTGVVIRNNICLDTENQNDPLRSTPQGYVGFDGLMKDFVVENNVYISSAYHGVAYVAATNLMVRNNTIIDSDPVANKADTVWVRFAYNKIGLPPSGSVAKGNITNRVITDSINTFTNNQTVKIVDYDTIFRDWKKGDVRLKSGSPIQGAGANLDPATVGSNKTVKTISTPTNVVSTPTPVVTTPTPVVEPTPTPEPTEEEAAQIVEASDEVEEKMDDDEVDEKVEEKATEEVEEEEEDDTPVTTDEEEEISKETQVVTTDTLRVRKTPFGKVIGVQRKGASGIVISDATTVGAYDWVYVNFGSGVDGYVADDFLAETNSDTTADTSYFSAGNEEKIKQLIEQIRVLQALLAKLIAEQTN